MAQGNSLILDAGCAFNERAEHRAGTPAVSWQKLVGRCNATGGVVPEVGRPAPLNQFVVAIENVETVALVAVAKGPTGKLATNEGHDSTLHILAGTLTETSIEPKGSGWEGWIDAVPLGKCGTVGVIEPTLVFAQDGPPLSEAQNASVEGDRIREAELRGLIDTRYIVGHQLDVVRVEASVPTEPVEPHHDVVRQTTSLCCEIPVTSTLFHRC